MMNQGSFPLALPQQKYCLASFQDTLNHSYGTHKIWEINKKIQLG